MTILNIKKGDAPKTAAAIDKAKLQYMRSIGFPHNKREALINQQMTAIAQGTTDPEYVAALPVLQAFEAALTETYAINTFNEQLAEYLPAVARLAQVELAVGRAETQVGTGVFEPDPVTGEPVEVMQTIPAIPALVAEPVEYPVFDETTGEQTGTAPEPDREVTAQLEKDAAERAAMQQVIGRTPQEVKDFAG